MSFEPDAGILARLRILEDRVAIATRAFRATDPNPEDPYRGLYITDEHIDRLLERGTGSPARFALQEAGDAEPEISPILKDLERLGIDSVDADILIAAAAPDLDPRFERFYGYLHDDVSRRRASPGLVLNLLGVSQFDARFRARFDSDAPLLENGLLEVVDETWPFLTRELRVPDRVTNHLLGSNRADPLIRQCLISVEETAEFDPGIARVLAESPKAALYLQSSVDFLGAEQALAAARSLGREGIVIDLRPTHPDDRPATTSRVIREARLRSLVVVFGPIDDIGGAELREIMDSGLPVVAHGRRTWDHEFATRPVLPVRLAPPRSLGAGREAFQLSATSKGSAQKIATAADAFAGEVRTDSFSIGVRSQNSAGLERLARRVEASAVWEDLVVSESSLSQLTELVARVENRRRVLDDWGLRRGGGRGEGISALFAGESGTGKTFAAEVVAGALGLDLYVIDLSTVVDKYIGETEKNLERVFSQAEGVNGVLFFDEADALFGKRSEVSDAKDRYANVEVAYLLQRMEQFDGLAILATNLRGNIDSAFTRRLSSIIDFEEPEAEQRLILWGKMIGRVPLADDVDLDDLAERFDLAGGSIRNAVVTAAYRSASEGRSKVGTDDLIAGIAAEYRKQGRLLRPGEL